MSLIRTTACFGTWALAFMVIASAAGAHEGWGIVRDSLGRLYVADIPANTVWRIDANGRMTAAMRVHSHALVVGAGGAIYGTDVHVSSGIREVWRLDLSGRRTDVVAKSGSIPLNLQAFLIAVDGTVYSVSVFQYDRPPDARELFLLRRLPSGVIDTVAGGLAGRADGAGRSARFESVDGMAWLPDSSILLVDGARLRRVNRDGIVSTLSDELTVKRWDQDLMGVAVADDGAIYIADFAGHRILRVKGDERTVFAKTGWLWSPTGVTYAPDGIYTLEHLRAPFGILGDLRVGPYLRVRKIAAGARGTVIARKWGDRSWVAAFAMGGVAIAGLFLWQRRGSRGS